jgi:N-acetylmuramoyl-L-alanine amidase
MKTIVISAGHGGSDPGAVANGVQEKTANLAITLACRDYLNQHYCGHKLILPRETDIYVSLPARREMARGADLYISIHNNSFSNSAAGGFETFTHSGPLFETTLEYQRVIHRNIYDYVRGLGVRDRGMKRANHWVTANMPCPTVLVEYMFVSNPQEATLLKRDDVLKKLGEVTAKGIAGCLDLPVKPPQQAVWYRVIAGSYRDRNNAEVMLEQLKRQGIGAFIEVKHDV